MSAASQTLTDHWAVGESTRRGVARTIREAMAEQGVSQDELGNALGLSQATVSRRLAGLVAFNVVELWCVADLLCVNLVELLPED